jgi:hypothetical protein
LISGFRRHVNDIFSLPLKVILAVSRSNLIIKIVYLHLYGPEEITIIVIIIIIIIWFPFLFFKFLLVTFISS